MITNTHHICIHVRNFSKFLIRFYRLPLLALALHYIEIEYPQSIRFCVLNARRIRQDARLEEGGTLRANNGERRDRVTLVTEEIRVHGKAEAACLRDEDDKVIKQRGNKRTE